MSKDVLCSDCGFLGWVATIYDTVKEVNEDTREGLKNGIAAGQRDFGFDPSILHTLYCHRKQWVYTRAIKGSKKYYGDIKEIDKSRKCTYFFNYQPGYDPEEHKVLLNEKRLRNVTWHAALLGAGVGAAGAIAAQLIYVILTNG